MPRKILSQKVEEMRIKILNHFSLLENKDSWDLDDFKEKIGKLDDADSEEERYVNYFTEIFPTSLKLFQTMARYQTSISSFKKFNHDYNEGNPYLPSIYPDILDDDNRCDVLISLIGFSPEPVMHTICTLKPKEKIFLICSKETTDIRDVSFEDFVSKFIKENVLIKLSEEVDEKKLVDIDYQNENIEIETKVIHSNFSDEIINKIDKILETYKDNNETNIAIDITGGKKIMLSGAFTMASIYSVPGFYVDFEEYDKATGKPLYGTEFLNRVKNPLVGYILKKYNKWNYFKMLADFIPEDEHKDLLKKLNEENEYAFAEIIGNELPSLITQPR
jgi:hypothetical protein